MGGIFFSAFVVIAVAAVHGMVIGLLIHVVLMHGHFCHFCLEVVDKIFSPDDKSFCCLEELIFKTFA
jgi:hypothetical protein